MQRSAWPFALFFIFLSVYLRDAGILGQRGRNRKNQEAISTSTKTHTTSSPTSSSSPIASGITISVNGESQPVLVPSTFSSDNILSFSYCSS